MLWLLFEIIQFIQFIHLKKHLDEAWDTFEKKSLNGTFIVHQKKPLVPQNSKLHALVKKRHFGNFSEKAMMAVPC